jgi:hypothetical protein
VPILALCRAALIPSSLQDVTSTQTFFLPPTFFSPPPSQASLETPQISAIIITDTDAERLVAKFWSPSDFPDAAAELEFEKRLYKKIKAAGSGARADAEVLVLEGFTVVFKAGPDVTFAVVGPGEENDLMLVAVLDALWDTMSLLLKGAVEKRTILAQLELLLLALDELVEGGVPFELDPHTIEARVMLRGAVPETISSYNEMTLSTVADKFQDKLKKQFVR